METKKQMNVAMICDPVGNNKSGVVISALRFSHLLKERGHNVIFIGAKSKGNKSDSYYNGIKIYRFRSLPIPKSGGWHLAFPTIKELKKVFKQEKIDVVHIILPMSGAIVAIKTARILDIKIVAHSHSQPENLFTEMPKIFRPILDNLWNRYLVWVYSKAELLIYPSEMARNLLDKLSNKNQPSKVISNGIDTKEFKFTPLGDFCDRFTISDDKIKLLFVGRLFPEKSVDALLKAIPFVIEKHPNINLMIVGDGHLKSKLEKLTHTLNIEKYVNFLGIVSKKDKILAYNASDIFILPSVAELEGMVVLEAMACGKPIIVSDAKMSASRFFVNENGLLFQTGNPKNLAQQIIKLIVDKDLREKMGEISLERSKLYDINKSVELLEEAYYF